MAASLIGRKLGKYEITELIGRGGMATVYKAYQADVERYVAVKVMPPHPGQDEQYVERFRLEARTVARLQHPHILPLYDYGSDDGILYLVMALADGGSLSDLTRKGAMPPAEVERLLRQIASALDYAHRQGVVHRDIKPDNILLNREGYAMLADFGIVKIAEGNSSLTVTGGLMGTPAYMSPEQGQGLIVDLRSDLYSLAVVVYEMLTGTTPYDGDTPMQVVFKHITSPIPNLLLVKSDLPAELNTVLQRALAKEPAERYPSAGAFLEDFSRALHGQTLIVTPRGEINSPTIKLDTTQTARVPAPTEQMQPTMLSAPPVNPFVLLGGFAIIAVLLVVVVIVVLNFWQQSQPAAVPTRTVAAPTSAPVVVNAPPTFGRISFSTTNQPGDTVNLQVEGLSPPPNGQTYVAWLGNADGEWESLGSLRLDPLGSSVLPYVDSENRNLAALFNRLVITQEVEAGDVPGDQIVYSGGVPNEVTAALREILVTSPNGFNNSSLLDATLTEARIGRQHAGLAARASSVGGLHTHAEHTINILRGTNEDYNGDGRGDNPGRGVGVVPLLDRISERLNNAAGATDDSRLQSQIELIRVCIANSHTWVDQIIALEMELAAATSVEAVARQQEESTVYAARLMEGDDLNANGQVEPFEGECGLEQIATYGVSVGNMDIVQGVVLPEATETTTS